MTIFTRRIDDWILPKGEVIDKKKWLRCPICGKTILTTRKMRTCKQCKTNEQMAQNWHDRKMGIKKKRGRKGGAR